MYMAPLPPLQSLVENRQWVSSDTTHEDNEICIMGPKKYKTEEERKQAKAEQDKLRYENINQQEAASAQNGDISARAKRLQKIAASQRKRRLDESLEVRVERLNQDAESHRRQRENESELETAARLQNIAASQRKRRLDESELETAARLQNIAASQRKRRLDESLEVRVKRLNQDAESHRRQRENESELETAARRENDRQIHIRRHQNQSINLRRHRQQSADLVTEDENSVVEHTCGLMSVICLYCESHNLLAERPLDGKFTQCCQKGKVVLPQHKYPVLLEDLMKQRHQHSKNFLENIRSINSSFAFASMGAQVSPPPGYGPYCFRIQGQIYHRTGTLHPEDGEGRKFAQLYILDTEVATEERLKLKENQGCNKDLMNAVATLLQQINPFTEAYRMLGDVEKEEERKAKENNTELPSIVMAIKQDRKQNHRRYNNPRVSEVAVIFESDDGEPPFQRDILIHLRPDPLDPFSPNTQRISLLHRNLDALLYPLFYPRGEQGWHDQIWQVSTAKPHRVTQLQFYSYCLSERNSFNPLLNGGKLTQQFIVDAYVKIEANRLNYVRMNQKDLRVEDYCVVQQHLENRAIQNGIPIGKMVILPSSFEGSPRNMQQRYQDAMAIVEKHGKPDLFVTMTCNPKWKDITDNLEDWQRVEHRPDLIARVFKLKLEQLLKEINEGLFGTVKAMVYVIEYQKRGLPHAHILLFLNGESKLRTEEDVDNVVWAEIPDEEKYPVLNSIVLENMIHGPCGTRNPNCPCMENGVCTKGFPKDLQQFTITDGDGYPRYRRRKGKTYLHKGKSVDNSLVVPYNPYLLKKFNCHINVEICASIKSVKYLFKYVYKGHDKANVAITETAANHDETSKFVDSRYVSAPEAIWRIFTFKMHEQSHVIYRLAVHLPNAQALYFNENDSADNLHQKLSKSSALMEWFKLNQNDQEARNYFYREIPNHYVWETKKTKGTWQPRQRGGENVIGRMYTVSVSDQERYFLRILLLHVKGATSFEYLRTVDGNLHSTFKKAAQAHGLLLDDTMWRLTIRDACLLSMPQKLRELFAYICVYGPPTSPLELWQEFKEQFTEDFCHRHTINNSISHESCESFAMREVQNILVLHGRSFKEFDLPEPDSHLPCLIEDYDEAYELSMAAEMRETLNDGQRAAYNVIIDALEDSESRTPKCFFIDGPGGSGKTFLYELLMHHVRGFNDVVLPSATTGIAANLLTGGRTMHSFYGIPVPINETSVSHIKMDTNAAKLLKTAKLLIIDECTMAHRHALPLIDRLLREVMSESVSLKCQIPFGGKVIVFGGDFRQCLPVIPNGTRTEIVDSCIKQSYLWSNFSRLPLEANMRCSDIDYCEWLLKLGNGELTNEHNLGEDVIEIPSEMLCTQSIVIDIFGHQISIDITNTKSIKKLASHAILCPKNDDVDLLNSEIMDRITGEDTVYKSDDTVVTDEDDQRENYPVEFLNSLSPSGMPPHRLRLKIGAIVMLLRNLNTKKGLCNGTRLIVTNMLPNVIAAKVITGSAAGDDVFIPRIDLCPSEIKLPFRLKRRQFPIKLAFAMTINKSQGQSSKKDWWLPCRIAVELCRIPLNPGELLNPMSDYVELIISDMWIEEFSYSDHLPIVLQINTGYEAIKSSYNNEILTRKFIWTKENVEMLKHNLSDIEDGNETDINTETVNFTKQIYTAMESANIIKFVKRRHQLSKPWYDKDCYIMKKTTKKFMGGGGRSPTTPPCGPPWTLGIFDQILVRFQAMAAALQKIDIDPEQQLYTPKIVDIAAAVIEMHRDI
ncbi:hypothetical protein LAZ67_5001019 [Cordylochernes scorpioides]|uniref:ATP-dependent DNA helicase n=1 Tax=Cordylochernes scorpioides TaxID=51811 RepID=A0ABY6KFB1_9ARAC|nr:hypothetical protein LAZ67_5001019 [Cordylochernes scorpioides]